MRALVLLALAAAAAAGADSDSEVTVNVGTDDEERAVQMREATRVLGAEHNTTLKLSATLAQTFYTDPRSSPDKLREAVEIMERTVRTTRRVFGGAHPMTRHMQKDLANARMRMEARAVV